MEARRDSNPCFGGGGLISTLRSLRSSATLRLYSFYSTLTAETQRNAENAEKISKVSHYLFVGVLLIKIPFIRVPLRVLPTYGVNSEVRIAPLRLGITAEIFNTFRLSLSIHIVCLSASLSAASISTL